MADSVNGQFGKIISQARKATPQERPVLLKRLADLASSEDPFMIAAIAKEVAHYELSTATEFKKAVSAAASHGKRSKVPKPTDDELARLWVEAFAVPPYGEP